MARTAIEGGCKATKTATAVDTLGYGKVTIIATAAGAIKAVGGDDSGHIDIDIAAKIVNPTTGKVESAVDGGVYSYIGDCRYITVSAPACVVLLSEPRTTN